MITIYKDKLVQFIERWSWMTDKDEGIKPLYKFIDDSPVWEPFIDNLLKEVRMNLYELSKEKSITYINELIFDLNIIEINVIHKKQLLEDYGNRLVRLPESGADKSYLDFLILEEEHSLRKKLYNEVKEMSISDAIFIMLNIHREFFLERLAKMCEDFNLPFRLNPNETIGQRLQEIKSVNDAEYSFNEPNLENYKTRIKWKGTPGEFGAIFDLLIDNGFIKLIKDKKNMVRLLYSVFEIKNEKGEVVSSEYLYKCFKDKIKSYPNGYLKIPFSDNYHNDK